MSSKSVFKKRNVVTYHTEVEVDPLVGTMPADPEVKERWIRSMFADPDEITAREISERMLDANVSQEQAISDVISLRGLNGFRVDAKQQPFVPAWSVRACILETANILWSRRKWAFGKETKNGWPEHLMVAPKVIYLPKDADIKVEQRFVKVSGPRGQMTSIAYDQYVDECPLSFDVVVDKALDDAVTKTQWEELWSHAERFVGIGGQRKALKGRFVVTRWDKVA